MVRTGDKQGPKRAIRPGTRVCVTELSESVRKTSLQAAFGDFGNVDKIELFPEQRMAYIEFEDPADAQDAAKDMDGKLVEKSKIRTKLMEDRPRASMDHALRVQKACLANIESRAADFHRVFGGLEPRSQDGGGRDSERSRNDTRANDRDRRRRSRSRDRRRSDSRRRRSRSRSRDRRRR
eukprot:TRINITY_DN16958_c0_g4_i1.p1 TRINITY_DN16958_c0_g4~~TRINITY_DN16958_c0_g4_i1.p1  ORF type:complete len:180 (+),score=36.72 TRINITY_DN16958_c0_g4_i1:236-775(+)